MTEIAYTLFGEPLSMPRPRVSRYGSGQVPESVRELKSRHAEAGTLSRPDGWSLEGRFSVVISVYKGTARACDLDNLAKLPLDALTGVLYADDSQIDRLFVQRAIDRDDPRTEVRVIRLEGA